MTIESHSGFMTNGMALLPFISRLCRGAMLEDGGPISVQGS